MPLQVQPRAMARSLAHLNHRRNRTPGPRTRGRRRRRRQGPRPPEVLGAAPPPDVAAGSLILQDLPTGDPQELPEADAEMKAAAIEVQPAARLRHAAAAREWVRASTNLHAQRACTTWPDATAAQIWKEVDRRRRHGEGATRA